MKSAEIICKLRELNEEKDNLERKLNSVNEEISNIKGECSHIGVILDFVTTPCVLCKEHYIESDKYMQLREQGLIIDATGYLTSIEDYSERLDNIQTMYLGLCRQNPDKTDAEIVELFNQMIQESLNNESENIKENQQKALKRTD